MVVIPAVGPTGMAVGVIPISPPTTVSPSIRPDVTNSRIPDDHAWAVVGGNDRHRSHDTGSDDYRGWYSDADVNPCLRFGGIQGRGGADQASHHECSCKSHDSLQFLRSLK